MLWFLQEYPIVSGIIYSVVLGLPVGLATVWGLRDYNEAPKNDGNKWDDDWDL